MEVLNAKLKMHCVIHTYLGIIISLVNETHLSLFLSQSLPPPPPPAPLCPPSLPPSLSSPPLILPPPPLPPPTLSLSRSLARTVTPLALI